MGYFQPNLVTCLPGWGKLYNKWIGRLMAFYIYLQYFSRNMYEQEHFYYYRYKVASSVLGFGGMGHVG